MIPHTYPGSKSNRLRLLSLLFLSVLLVAGLAGARIGARADQEALQLKPTSTGSRDAIARLNAKQADQHTIPAPHTAPTEADLYDALKKGCFGSQSDRAAADALYRGVLRYDAVEQVHYIPYPVYGYTPEDIRASQAQTKAKVGINEWGYTHSKWSYRYSANQPVQLTLQTSITMPQWTATDPNHPSPPPFWPSFYNALLFHEQGHALIGEYAVALMRLRLNAAGAGASTNAGAICNQVQSEMDILNQQYDQATNHGVSQGARL